jgi:hypothetical protein
VHIDTITLSPLSFLIADGNISDGRTSANKIQVTKDVITRENSPDGQIVKETQEAPPSSPPFPQFECHLQDCGQCFNSQSELIAHIERISSW